MPMAISIKIDDVDITTSVIFSDAEFTTSAMGAAGTCSFRVRDLTHTDLFVVGKELTLDIDGVRSWGGYVSQIKRGYFFDGAPNHCDPLVPMYYRIEGVDWNILLSKRLLYDHDDARLALHPFDPGTDDDVVIQYYLQNYSDLEADGVVSTGVVHVGTPSTDDPIDGRPGETILDFLRRMAFNVGAIYYINPDKVLVYCDVDTEDAPFGISDQPEAGEVGCRDFSLDFDGSNLRNDALVWGAGQGSDHIHFSRITDATSIGTHGLWQVGLLSTAMFNQSTIDRTANSYVYGSPQNKRGGKDDGVSLRCSLFTSGFRVAQKVNVRSAVFGYEDVLPIRRMTITFPAPTQPKWELTISHQIDMPWIGFEYWLPPFPKIAWKQPKISIPVWGRQEQIEPGVILGQGDCVGGKVEFVAGTEVTVDGNTYTFQEAGGPYAMGVSFFPIGGASPAPVPPNYLGANWYLVDHNDDTYITGYWAWARGSINWDLKIPLAVSGAEIRQVIGVPSGADYEWWNSAYGPSGWRVASDEINLLYSIDGSTWIECGHLGPLGPTPVQSMVIVNNDPGVHARYWQITSRHATAEYVGMPHGEYGWGWFVNGANLHAYCEVVTGGLDNGTIGSQGYLPPDYTVPDGEDPNFVYIYLDQPWVPGTLVIYADGIYVPPTRYTVNWTDRWVQLPREFLLSTITVRYVSMSTTS